MAKLLIDPSFDVACVHKDHLSTHLGPGNGILIDRAYFSWFLNSNVFKVDANTTSAYVASIPQPLQHIASEIIVAMKVEDPEKKDIFNVVYGKNGGTMDRLIHHLWATTLGHGSTEVAVTKERNIN